MTVARFLHLVLLLPGLVLPGLAGCARREGRAGPPDVLLITLDTCRRDYLGCYGGRLTPTVDALAREGVLFKNAFCQVPLTLPSHASILTGLYPTTHGVRDNGRFRLDDRFDTLAEILSRNGFSTGAVVGAFPVAGRFGLSQGFDFYDDDLSAGSGIGTSYRERRAEAVTRAALRWLGTIGQKRFFLWVHYFDPHQPYDPPSPWKERFAHSLYAGEVAYTDAALGQLLDGMRDLGRRENCLIVVLADHGEGLGDHHETTHGLFLYDTTIHIPLIMTPPQGFARRMVPGRQIEEIAESVDVPPTLLDLLDIPVPDGLDGRSLAGLLGRSRRHPAASAAERDRDPAMERITYAETFSPFLGFGWSELRSVRNTEWKYIAAPRPELYHVAEDREELRNLYESRQDVAHPMAEELADLLRQDRAIVAQPLDSETLAKLRSLGYVGSPTPPSPAVVSGSGSAQRFGAPAGAPDPKDMAKVLDALLAGEEFLSHREPKKAAAVLREAVALDPHNESARLFLAQALLEMGDPEKSIKEIQAVLERNPTSAGARVGLAAGLFRQGKRDEAERELRQAVEVQPGFGLALYNLAAIEEARGNVAEASRLCRQALEDSPYLTEGWVKLGDIYSREGNWAEARRAWERALTISPDHPEVKRRLEALSAERGETSEAKGPRSTGTGGKRGEGP